MAGFSAYMQNAILDWIKGTEMPTEPAAVYVALFDGDPDGAGTEVTTDIRTAGRVAVTLGDVTDDESIANSALVDFGASASADDVDVTHFALFDDDAAGNMIGSAAVTTPRTVVEGAEVSFPIGALTFTVS